MKNDNKLSGAEMLTILSLLMVGTGILSLPRFLLEASEIDTWLIIIVGGIILSIVGIIYGYIISLYPGKGYFEILSSTLTKPVAHILCAIKVIYMMTLSALSIRIFGEVLKGSLFPMTPIEVIIFGMILVGGYGARQGVKTLGRIAKLLFAVMVPATVVIFALGLVHADFYNLLPVFEISFKELVNAVPRIAYSFIGFELILIYGMFLSKPKVAKKIASFSVLLVMILYLFVNTVTLAQFGAKQTLVLVWPTLSLIRTIDLPFAFFEDMTSLGLSLWVLSVFMSYLPNLMAGDILLGQMTSSKEKGFFSIFQLPLIYFIAMIPNNVPHIYVILDQVTKYISPLFLFIIPTLILIVTGIKRLVITESGSES